MEALGGVHEQAQQRALRALEKDALPMKGMAQTAEWAGKFAVSVSREVLSRRVKLADFYLAANKPDEAKRVLSEITQKVLPHDRLTMSFHDPDGNMVIEAASMVTRAVDFAR